MRVKPWSRFQAGTFQQLRSAYIDTGKVRYFHKNFPLRMHVHAFGASIAAYCAGEQGHFWEMHDFLYAKQARLGDALYRELIKKLDLDATKFDVFPMSEYSADHTGSSGLIPIEQDYVGSVVANYQFGGPCIEPSS